MSNAVVLENQKQGNPESEWGLSQGASSNIEGFATSMSYNLGDTAQFKINTDASQYRIDIYRMGWYNGDGARLVGSINHTGSEFQPAALKDTTTGLVDAGNWSVTDSWKIPDNLASGVYVAKLVRQDGTFGENQIPFVVRDDGSNSAILLKTSDETWQAYNPWGNSNVYEGGAKAVSYNRPWATEIGNTTSEARPWNFLFGEDYAAIRYLERNGFDVSYVAAKDVASNGLSLLNHKAFISVGHDEYWSAEERDAVTAARDAGVNLAFWGGNDVFWKTEWAVSTADGTSQPYRTVITYKDTTKDAQVNPDGVWTGMWRDQRYELPGENLTPENSLTGTYYMVDYDRTTPLNPLVVTSDYADLPLWRNTSVAQLTAGQSISFKNLIGYEWNVVADNGYSPATLVKQSSTTVNSNAVLQDILAKTVAPGSATHSLTLYKANSGALVFSAGTVMFSWALDDVHSIGPSGSGAGSSVSSDIQQAMINMFADMGITPETLQGDLVPGGSTGDSTAPTLTVAPWISNFKFWSGDSVAFGGTAVDTDGHLAGVIVSTDNGSTWTRTTGSTDWVGTFSFTGLGKHTLLVKAFDTSFNMSNAVAVSVSVDFQLAATLLDFSVDQGWSNTQYKRMFADLNGDGIKDLVGFGTNGTIGYFGGNADGTAGFRTPDTINVYFEDFAQAQGYTASSLRGVDYVGTYSGNAAVVWGQTANGIAFHVPTAIDTISVTYSATSTTYTAFGTASGWTSANDIDVGFTAKGSAFGSDAYASIIGFGDSGIMLGREAFAPGAVGSAATVVANSSIFGNASGWSATNDVRAVRDYNGHEIDLNHDGIMDVIGLGSQGTYYAFGKLTSNGTGGTTYALDAPILANNGVNGSGSYFGAAQGWTNSTTQRVIADVNNDGYVDIIGFGVEGIYVSLGQAPATDGAGAFAPAYLAQADFGNNNGWGATDHVRLFGDVNGDGIIDVIGFGDSSTLISFGSIDTQTHQINWTLDGLLGDYGISKGWNSLTHMRSVVDLNGDGKVEIFASGDYNTRITTFG